MLGGEGRRDVRDHLADCSGCRDRLATALANVGAILGETRSVEDRSVHETVPRLPDVPPPRPAMIGKYIIIGLLDDGGQGQVYRAVHRDLHLDAAIKIGRKPLGAGGAERNLLLAEGRLMARMRHENLVAVYDVDVHEDRPYLAMELVEGCNLQQRVERRRYTPKEAAGVVAQVARAVAFLDLRGIVHQDIKPKNVMIDVGGRPRLIDFGLARLRDVWSGGLDDPLGGTFAYMAPEQVRGDAEQIGPATDVFALGGLLYFLLTGRAPYEGSDSLEILDKVRLGAVDFAAMADSGAPKRLERITRKALDADPARRPSAQELGDELDRCARVVPRRAILASVSALVVVALGILFGYLYAHGYFTSDPLHTGSTWVGWFYWATDNAKTPQSMIVRIESRQGEAFTGRLQDERGEFIFEIQGVVRGGKIVWSYPSQLNGEPKPIVVATARGEGEFLGKDIMVGRTFEGFPKTEHDIAFFQLYRSPRPLTLPTARPSGDGSMDEMPRQTPREGK
jgi:serine/threonine protein kinase